MTHQRQQSSPHTTSSLPLSAALIMAEAHPTPLSTSMAWEGQFFRQAPHSMQSAGLANLIRSPSRAKTRWGHTFRHIPHRTHRPG